MKEWSEDSSYRVIIVDNFTNQNSPLLKQRNIDYLMKRYPRRIFDGSFVLIRGSINDRHLMKIIFEAFRVTHVADLAVIIYFSQTFSNIPSLRNREHFIGSSWCSFTNKLCTKIYGNKL